jgi:hypothetical protein
MLIPGLIAVCLPKKTEVTAAAAKNEYRILFIGNSITRHEFNDNTIKALGWDHLSGMAASTESKDYAHLLSSRIQEKLPGRNVEIYFHRAGGNGSVKGRLATIDSVKFFRPDLVVIQMGEHEKAEDGQQTLKKNYDSLLHVFDDWPTRPRILCTGVWCPQKVNGSSSGYTGWVATIEQTMERECRENKIPFVSVEKYALDPRYHGWGTSEGVKWHPNDKGMEAYATGLFNAFCKYYLRSVSK